MKKITVTIGIPAFNEEGNIVHLLESIYRQQGKLFNIQEILVISDGSTDKTEELVQTFSKTHKRVKLIADRNRTGKSERLNTLYRIAQGEFILSLDADVFLKNDDVIEKLVGKVAKNTNVVGARFIPVPQSTFMGKLSVISYESFEDAFLNLKNGCNIYSLVGGAQLIRTSFAKKVTYPRKTISDQNYLYAQAIQGNAQGYSFAQDAEVWTRTVSTFHDWRVLGVRSTIEDKQSLRRNVGNQIMKEYYMPRNIFAKSLIKFFFKHPVLTVGSVIMNLYIRLFPYTKSKPKNGKWELTLSSKIGILM